MRKVRNLRNSSKNHLNGQVIPRVAWELSYLEKFLVKSWKIQLSSRKHYISHFFHKLDVCYIIYDFRDTCMILHNQIEILARPWEFLVHFNGTPMKPHNLLSFLHISHSFLHIYYFFDLSALLQLFTVSVTLYTFHTFCTLCRKTLWE